MKRIIGLLAICMFTASLSHSQTVVYQEGFEGATPSVTTAGTQPWAVNTTLYSTGTKSYSAHIINPGDSSVLTTTSFSTVGSTYVLLEFSHICKIEFFDAGEVYVSANNGSSWTQLTEAHYLGTGGFSAATGNKFTATTYNSWLPGNPTPPTNGWWQTEIFDISSIAANAGQVMVRYILRDINNTTQFENWGWVVDGIKVTTAISELTPPTITLQPPIIQDTAYNTGPYDILATITDASGVNFARLVYNLNSGPDDTLVMVNTTGNDWLATIPSFTYNNTVNYYIYAVDSSLSANHAQTQVYSFFIKKSLGSGQNVALTATATHSGGGATTYGPQNYNDDIIPPYGTLPWGWVSTNGWIEYTWINPVTFNKIRFHKDNRPMTSCVVQIWDGNNYTNIQNYSGTATEDSIIFLTPYTTTKLRFNQVAGSSNPNHREIQVFAPQSTIPLSYDAGVTHILDPAQVIYSSTPTPVSVRIKNFAVDTLSKVAIGWSVNGVVQTPFQWTGTLLEHQVSQILTIDSFPFPVGQHTLKIWTSMPNDSIDQDFYNDTLTKNILVCSGILAGNYTVGTGGDYATIQGAVDAMLQCGIGGAVTFNVLPGTYTGQWNFTNIPGTSAANTITFRSSTGNPNNVIWEQGTVSTNFTVRFDGAQYFNLKGITIKSTNPTYGRVVEFLGNSRHITIDSCIIDAPLSTSSSAVPVYSTTSADYNITISNSTLKGGYYGVYYYSNSSTKKIKFNLLMNTIIDYYYYGVYTYYVDSVNIVGNYLTNQTASGTLYPMYIGYTTGHGVVSRNRIISTGSGTCYGLYLYYKQATSTAPLLVSNNFISQSGNPSGTVYGVYMSSSNYIDFYNNSVHIAGGSVSAGRGLYQTSGASINIVNNIFANSNGGYAYYINTPTAILNSDYNDFYTTGNTLAYWSGAQTTLAGLQQISGKEANSYNLMPPFSGPHDLALTNTLLSAKATVLAAVTEDFFGNPRTAFPTIGAHEVPLIPKDAGVINFVTPTPQTVVAESASVPVTVTIQNFGTDTLSSVDVFYSVNGGLPATTTYTGQLLPFQTTVVIMPSFTSPAGIVDICAWTTLPGDSNTFNDTTCIAYFATPTTDAMLTRILPVNEGCGLGLDTIRIMVKNLGATPVTGSFNVSYRLIGNPVIVTDTVTTTIALNDSIQITFSTPADFSTMVDSTFIVQAWVKVPGDNVLYNDTAKLEVLSLDIPPPPVVSDTTIPYASYVTLFAQSPENVLWYASDTAILPIAVGANFTTPILFDTTVYWVGAASSGSLVCYSIRVPLTVKVMGIPPYDLGISELLVKEGCAVYNEPVTIKVYNQGTDTLKGGATASFRVDNNPWMPTETIPDTIAPGTSIYYTFNSLANLTAPLTGDTMFSIAAWVNMTGDPNHQNDSIYRDSIMSLETPAAPTVTTPVNIAYGTQATLNAQSPMPVEWFGSDTSTVLLDTGYTFVTPPVFDTTTFWAQAGSAMGPPMSLYTGAQSSIYNASQTRGYHFTAPVNMTITELMVPTTVNSGPQYIQVVKFQGYPLAYPSYSPHTTLEYIANAPFGVPVQVNIPIQAGDEIGIIGATHTSGTTMSNSYGASQVPSSIGGIPVVLTRLVYQSPLVNGAAPTGSIALEVSASIARVEMTYVVGGLGCPSLRVPVQVNPSPPPPVDAGIEEIVNPYGSAASNVPHPVEVKIRNYGLNTLTSANIVWSLDNVVQDTVPWTGSLTFGGNQVVTLDTMSFSGGLYCIKAWTTMPNGVADTVALNDTSQHCFNACLAGIYTIGNPTTGNWDYNSFNQAIIALQTVGVCGHVIFDVQPGTYTEQLTIPEINGMDENNTVTFRSATGDSTQVILQYTAAGSADNWTVKLNGADWFRFEKMTIKANNGTYGRVVELTGGAENNRFERNRLVSAGASSSTTSCIYDGSTLNHYNTYLNNYMEGGYYTMYIYGSGSTSWQKGTVIEGNELVGSYYYPMYVYYTDSVQIIGNHIHSGVAPYSYGIYCNYPNNAYRIIGNRVEIVATSSSTCYGIRDYYGNYYSYNATPSGYGLVANNMVSITGGTAAHYGLYAYYCNGTEYYYNSISVIGGSTSARALYQYNTASNTLGQKFANNIFSNPAGGYAAYFGTTAQVTSSDYNNYWGTATNFVYWNGNVTTLAALQSASNMESHSHNIDPPFVSAHDLHLANTLLSAKGTPVPAVTYDIDGDTRSPLPTIGADEVPLIPNDAGVTAILSPGAYTNEGQVYPVQVTVTNFGTNTIQPNTLTIEYNVNGGPTSSTVYTGAAIPTLGTATVTLQSMTSPAGNSVICAKTILAGDSNLFNDETCKSFFGTPVNDAMVIKMVGLEDGCNIGLDTISIWVRNMGVNAINSPSPSTVNVSYRIKPTLPAVTQAFTPVVLPGDSVLFHFSTLADFSVTTVDDTFRVKAWVDLQGDNVKYNDTAYFEVISLHVPPPPVVNDTTIPYATSVTLYAQSPDTVFWFAKDTSSVELATGAYYTTPLLYTNTTYWVQAGTGHIASSGPYVPGVNIAPLAIASASNCSTGPCSSFNDLNLGTCGSQQVWISTSNPPSLVPHTNWIDFEWPTPVSIDGMLIHHAQNNARFLTGATLYKWDSGNWVDFYTFSNLPMQCENTVPFPMVTTTKLRITSFQMTGSGQTSNPNFREIEVFEALATGCNSIRVPLVVTVSNPQPCDVGVSAIVNPVTAVNLGSQENVTLKIKNYGTASQSNIPVSYKIDNLPVVTETITATIASQDSLNYTFTAKANLSISGNTYQVKAWTGLSCDNTPQNDTAWKSVTNLLPNYCISTATSALYEEITNVSIGTIFSHTSPATGAMYTNHTTTALPPMLSPGLTYPMSITSSFAPGSSSSYNCWVKVWIDFNRDGTFDPVTEEIFSQATTSSNTVTANIQVPFNAVNGNTMMRVVLNQTTSASSVTPCNTYTYGETEDYMVTIAPQAVCDAGVIQIISPQSLSQAGTPIPVWVKFMNFGSDPIAPGALSIAYKLNNGTPVVVNYPGGLASGGYDSIQMPAVTLPMGNNTFCAYTILACDSTLFNDEVCKGAYGQFYTTLPFFDDFETANMWYKPAVSTNWQYGTPSANIITSAYSGSKAWVTNLTGDYSNNCDEYLYTPVFSFMGLGGSDTITISFYHFCAMPSADFGRVQYSTNNGQTWINLGTVGDPYGTNWYNISSGGQNYFCHTNSGWMYSAYKLDPSFFNAKPEVQFRFQFWSNASGTSNGWAIDNFRLSLPVVPNDVGVTAINVPLNDTAAGVPVNVKITISNFGTNTQNMIPVELRLNGNLVTSETWTGTVASNSTTQYTFVLPFTVPATSYTLCATTALTNDPYPMNDDICKSYSSLPAYHDVGIGHILAPLPDSVGRICFYEAATHPWYQFPVLVSLKNYGQNPQTSVPINYTFFNGGPVQTEIWTGSLGFGDSVVVTLGNLFPPKLGVQQLCVETDLLGDFVTTNNKACKTYTGVTCIGVDQNGNEMFTLKQNVPNPAKGTTVIGYSVPQGGRITFGLLNMLGQMMHSENHTVAAGDHQVEFDVSSLAAGVYYYYVEYNGQRLTRKMVVGR